MDFRKQSNHNSERDGNRFAASFFLEKRKSVAEYRSCHDKCKQHGIPV